jgi:hypothetical protein
VHRAGVVEGWLHDPPLLLDAVLAGESAYVPGEGVVEKSFVGRWLWPKAMLKSTRRSIVRVDMVRPAAPPAGEGPPPASGRRQNRMMFRWGSTGALSTGEVPLRWPPHLHECLEGDAVQPFADPQGRTAPRPTARRQYINFNLIPGSHRGDNAQALVPVQQVVPVERRTRRRLVA